MREILDIPYGANDFIICFIWADDYCIDQNTDPFLTIGCERLDYLIQLQNDAEDYGNRSLPRFIYDSTGKAYRLKADARLIEMLGNENINWEGISFLRDFLDDIGFPAYDKTLTKEMIFHSDSGERYMLDQSGEPKS